MAEFLWTFAVQEVLKKLVNLASDQIALAWGLEKELEKLKEWLLNVEAILNGINKNKLHHDAVRLWVEGLQHIVHEAEDLLDELVYEDLRRKVQIGKTKVRAFVFPSNISFVFRLKMAKKMKDILDMLSKHYNKANPLGLVGDETIETKTELSQLRETISECDDFEVVGRDIEVSSIVKQVIDARNQQVISILPIVGMGGMGKTTLAKLVFNHEMIKEYFDQFVWVCVSEPFLVNKILGAILENLRGTSSGLDNKEVLLHELKKEMHGKRYFLVLDDVWNEKSLLWEELKKCLMRITEKSENCIVVTTRSAEVAKIMETLPSHYLSKLSNDQCWSLFQESANANGLPMTSNLKDVQEELVKKIGGLPLVARVLGSAVKFQGDYNRWVTILESIVRTPLQEEDFVKSILKLSVEYLPSSSLKQCFAYCSSFPKDFMFEKKLLIRMWMAQGFIRLQEGISSNKTMEDEGDRYFKILLSRCLFQDVVKDRRGKIRSCKMHDLIHDIACDASIDKKLQLDDSDLLNEELWTNRNEKSASKLRTIVLCYIDMQAIPNKIVNFVSLRVLVINSNYIYKLPNSIGKLKHLRYLDISDCFIQKLPKSIVLLYHLQTLRIENTPILDLPKNLSELVSLRHLEFSKKHFGDIKQMPPHLSQLNQLQTLSVFVVGFEEGCKITELGPLKNLKGSLKLTNLERVKSKEEARATKLVEKENLRDLVFIWSWAYHREVNDHNDLEVLEGLQPHKNLQYLNIQFFLGECLPNKIFVENLVAITLDNCRNCEKLPMLGHLTNLEELRISHLNSVRSIGNEFYGNDSNQRTFPKLKEFILQGMYNLEQWEEVMIVASNVTTFPRLQVLNISNCPMLLNIPDLFGFCDENGFMHLTNVEILECPKFTKLPNGLQLCHSIQHLRIKQCCSYLTLNLQNRNMLSSLRIMLPQKLAHLTNLKGMYITGCIQHHGPLNLCSSTELQLKFELVEELRNVTQRPQQLEPLTTLQDLSIQDFGSVEALPEWLENLTSLQVLNLSFCLNFGD